MSTYILNVWETELPFKDVFNRLKEVKQSLMTEWREECDKVLRVQPTDKALINFCSYIYGGVNTLNPTSSVVIYPHPDNSNLLVQIFGVSRERRKEFAKLIEGVDQSWQNQTDIYDATEEEWSRREDMWSRIFQDSYCPSECGMSFDLITQTEAVKTACKAVIEHCGFELNGWSVDSSANFWESSLREAFLKRGAEGLKDEVTRRMEFKRTKNATA